jgi:hypothetical protein
MKSFVLSLVIVSIDSVKVLLAEEFGKIVAVARK